MDVKDVYYQFKVIFPKVPRHTEEERREMKRQVISYIGKQGNDNLSLASGRYATEEDIQKKREMLEI